MPCGSFDLALFGFCANFNCKKLIFASRFLNFFIAKDEKLYSYVGGLWILFIVAYEAMMWLRFKYQYSNFKYFVNFSWDVFLEGTFHQRYLLTVIYEIIGHLLFFKYSYLSYDWSSWFLFVCLHISIAPVNLERNADWSNA